MNDPADMPNMVSIAESGVDLQALKVEEETEVR